MLLFTLKKWFFDMWDSVLKLLVLNALFITFIAFPLSMPGWMVAAGLPEWLAIAVFVAGVVLSVMMVSAIVYVTSLSVDYQSWGLSEFWYGARHLFVRTTLFAAMNVGVFLLLRNAVPFYMAWENTLGYAAVAIMFWLGVFWIMMSQLYLPLYCRMGDPFFKTWKKSLLVALDNPGFTFFLLIVLVGGTIVSEFTAYMFPGIFGLIILVQGAVRLRLKKYDYLEENPEAKRNKIPWRALLQDDRTKIGRRSVKGMFFPWKE